MAVRWRKPPSTRAAVDDPFLLTLANDTEDAPWMVMGDLQFDAASSLKYCLRTYAHTHALPWYVAAMLPIRYRVQGRRRKRQLAPDCFVSFVPDHARESYNLEAEGVFPAFVLEVVSPSSVQRDEQDKLIAYDLLGAQEYVLFTPHAARPSTLAGYRRDAAGLVPWPLEEDGSLWSALLGLRLVVEGGLLLARTAEGELLRSPEQEAAARLAEARARQEADWARQEAERARQEEALARREADRARLEAEAENERLRQEVARLRRERD